MTVANHAFTLLKPYYHRFKTWVYQYPWVYNALQKLRQRFTFIYPESPLAHRYLDGLYGMEIGASAFNPFGLNSINVNYTIETDAVFRRFEATLARHNVKVDVVASGDRLPFADASWDFVLTSHVIEHFFDPIVALREWYRVTKPGGYLFLVVPHKERVSFDKARPRTALAELIERHAAGIPNTPSEHHPNVWITEDFLELCRYLAFPVIEYQDIDDKVGNGFTVVVKKPL